jgi:hypothetical protein
MARVEPCGLRLYTFHDLGVVGYCKHVHQEVLKSLLFGLGLLALFLVILARLGNSRFFVDAHHIGAERLVDLSFLQFCWQVIFSRKGERFTQKSERALGASITGQEPFHEVIRLKIGITYKRLKLVVDFVAIAHRLQFVSANAVL